MTFQKFFLFTLLTALGISLSGCMMSLKARPDENDWQNQNWSTGYRNRFNNLEESRLTNCPVYIPPETKISPKSPIEEFKKANSKNREDVLLDYIEDLREYIKEYKSIQTDTYLRYLQQCTRINTK